MYKCNTNIIKPIDSSEEANWLAETFSALEEPTDIRIQRPVRSVNGNWIENGYVSWTFVEGKNQQGRYAEKVAACEAYNRLVSTIPEPTFISQRTDPWATADKRVWGELPIEYEPEEMEIVENVLEKIENVHIPYQIIHGDFNGNILFSDTLQPAIIDYSPYWRPADFAKAIIYIDAVVWDKEANLGELKKLFAPTDQLYQLTIRATLRRMFEQFEHIRMRNMDPEERLAEARAYSEGFNKIFF